MPSPPGRNGTPGNGSDSEIFYSEHVGPNSGSVNPRQPKKPTSASALEVLAANGVDVMLAHNGEYTPTPAVSHAILTYNKERSTKLADGIVITPSHNLPDSGGFKYNPYHGGPAGVEVTGMIESLSNELLKK